MASGAENNIDPWGRSLIETLRRWWWIPAILAIIGAAIGAAAGLNAPKEASALLRVQISSDNPDATTQAVQSAMSELDTSEVYTAAAAKAGVTAGVLRSHTEILAVPNSTSISVKVTAPDARAAATEANAVAQAAIQAASSRLQNQLNSLTNSTEALINDSKLADNQAEVQRLLRLGGQLADNQSALLNQSRQLTLLQSADAGAAASTSPLLLAGMGLVGGGLAGIAITLLFGGRRGRMGSLREMRRLYPDVEFIPARDVPAVLSMEAGTADRVVLSGVHIPTGAVRSMVDPVTAGVHAVGRDVVVTEDVAQLGSNGASRPGEEQSVTVLQAPLSGAIVKRVARDPRSVLLVMVRPHKTRFEWLDEHAAQFGDRTYVVVDG